MNSKEIDELQRRRSNLQIRIKDWLDSGKNAIELVKEYHEIIDRLAELGVKAEFRAEYLKLEYWGETPKQSPKPVSQTPPPPIKEPEVEKVQPKLHHIYTLNLAWVETDNNIPIQVQKVKSYFKDLCLKCNGEDVVQAANGTEHVLKYEFEGTEESFRLLKVCTQFVLDSFAQTDFDKFNIAVFGKKRPY
jgi:hypothetical protein